MYTAQQFAFRAGLDEPGQVDHRIVAYKKFCQFSTGCRELDVYTLPRSVLIRFGFFIWEAPGNPQDRFDSVSTCQFAQHRCSGVARGSYDCNTHRISFLAFDDAATDPVSSLTRG